VIFQNENYRNLLIENDLMLHDNILVYHHHAVNSALYRKCKLFNQNSSQKL